MSRPQSPTAAPAAQLENVGLRYGRGPEVLRDVTLTLAQGSFHFLTGPSGAGKTSLLKILYLALRPSRGLVSIFGHDVGAPDRHLTPLLRRRIGVVFQDFRLIDHLSVFDNIALPLRVADQKPEEYIDDVEELLKWVGLDHRRDAAPSTLSGGEKQRVAIARAVINRPDLLLADEPTGNVDPAMGDRLINLLLQLNRQGATVLVATHDPELVRAVEAPELELKQGTVTRRRREFT